VNKYLDNIIWLWKSQVNAVTAIQNIEKYSQNKAFTFWDEDLFKEGIKLLSLRGITTKQQFSVIKTLSTFTIEENNDST
jgi:hypothetical protein